ncbi:permease [Deltaproteobacteria bacterium]|nr:permease [Deltaproteobacteria bacterium]
MTLLTRYLVRANLFLLFICLLIGTGLYVLTDLFQRLDNFLDASLSFWTILWYYFLKTPLIIGQILPAVFLVGIIVQFCLMNKARELIALQSGGISSFVFFRFVLLYGVLWAVAQLLLVQVAGIEGEQRAVRLWKEQVQGEKRTESWMRGLWFVDNAYIVHLGRVNPAAKTGTDFLAYQLTDDDQYLRQMVKAESFSIEGTTWRLYNATVITPDNYGYEIRPSMTIPLKQDISAFVAIDPKTNPKRLAVWDLRSAIASLEKSGSNVEVLQTTYHSRFAYAASLVAMGVWGLAIVLWTGSVYFAVGIGMVSVFLLYALITLFISLGEKGILPPHVASYFPIAFLFVLGCANLFWRIRPRWRR